MEAESTHKYDTRDYTKIDPQFGTNEEFARLVKEAHAHGIRIMVDAVFNHCGRSFGPWADVVEKKSGSPYADWFMIQDWDAFEAWGYQGREILFLCLYGQDAEAEYQQSGSNPIFLPGL